MGFRLDRHEAARLAGHSATAYPVPAGERRLDSRLAAVRTAGGGPESNRASGPGAPGRGLRSLRQKVSPHEGHRLVQDSGEHPAEQPGCYQHEHEPVPCPAPAEDRSHQEAQYRDQVLESVNPVDSEGHRPPPFMKNTPRRTCMVAVLISQVHLIRIIWISRTDRKSTRLNSITL